MRIFAGTDTGLVRSSNQDAQASGYYPGGAVWAAVCDGMGGANGGEYASSRAVEVIEGVLSEGWREEMAGSEIRSLLGSALLSANIEVYKRARSDVFLFGMGTTAVIAIVSGSSVYTAHVGDSRAYKISGNTLTQLTTDHSMVQELVDSGRLTPEQAKNHPRKNIITRAVGIHSSVEIDYTESQFDKGDMILLCSDGLSNYIEREDIIKLARETEAERLPEAYIRKACDGGGGDNITAVIICE